MHKLKAKTIHGNETRKARTERVLAMRRLRELEDLGYKLGIMYGARTRGENRRFQLRTLIANVKKKYNHQFLLQLITC